MKSRLSSVLPVLLLCLYACACENENERNKGELTIIAGGICGWCAGIDSVVITKDLTSFEFANCDSKISKSEATKESDWNELKNSLDLGEFREINLNTCYVCADGCDIWIEIRSASFSHRIRYGYNDSIAVSEIEPFLEKVHSIRRRYLEERASDHQGNN